MIPDSVQGHRSPGSPEIRLLCLDDGYEPARTARNMLATVTPARLTGMLKSLGEFDAGLGASLKFSPTKHQTPHAAWPSIIALGKVVSSTREKMTAPELRRVTK